MITWMLVFGIMFCVGFITFAVAGWRNVDRDASVAPVFVGWILAVIGWFGFLVSAVIAVVQALQ